MQNKDYQKLRSCPFCGGKAITVHIPDNTETEMRLHPSWEWRHPGQWIVGCETDMCLGYYGHITMVFPDKKNATKAWNRRADDGGADMRKTCDDQERLNNERLDRE